WQLDRANEKAHLFADYQAASESGAPDLTDIALTESERPPRYAEVTLQGRFLEERYLLLDNHVFEGQVGYQALGLFALEQAEPNIVLVNIGFVAAPASRAELPNVDFPSETMTLSGLLNYPDQNAFQLAEQELTLNGWPLRIQQVEFDEISRTIGISLLPVVVLLSEQQNKNNDDWGLPRRWQPNVITPAKHRGYAVQWFGLAIACALVFLVAARR